MAKIFQELSTYPSTSDSTPRVTVTADLSERRLREALMSVSELEITPASKAFLEKAIRRMLQQEAYSQTSDCGSSPEQADGWLLTGG
jgi:hypothetical protein